MYLSSPLNFPARHATFMRKKKLKISNGSCNVFHINIDQEYKSVCIKMIFLFPSLSIYYQWSDCKACILPLKVWKNSSHTFMFPIRSHDHLIRKGLNSRFLSKICVYKFLYYNAEIRLPSLTKSFLAENL